MTAREPPPRLGRGLAALLSDTAPAIGSPLQGTSAQGAGVQPLSVECLEPSPFQPRARPDQAALDELTQSIRERGILQPLLARAHPTAAERFQIIAGERRWRAAREAGLRDVPVLVRSLSDAEAMAASLVENLQRLDLNPIEEAEGYQRLIREFGQTQDALAQTIGKSRSHVANTLRLLQLPDAVQIEVRNGALSAGHARALLGHPDPAKVALNVIARGLSVRQTEALPTQPAPPHVADRAELADANTRDIERQLTERLGLRVRVTFDGKNGTVRIHYRGLEQLDGLISLLDRD